jgi:hypothetical protein
MVQGFWPGGSVLVVDWVDMVEACPRFRWWAGGWAETCERVRLVHAVSRSLN